MAINETDLSVPLRNFWLVFVPQRNSLAGIFMVAPGRLDPPCEN